MDTLSIISLNIFLLTESIEDIKNKALSVGILIGGGIINMAVSLMAGSISPVERLAGLAAGFIIIAISKLSSGQIGMGDGIIFIVIGFATGIINSILIFFYSTALAAVISGILLVFKKVNRKQKIPFVPFVYIGYLLSSVT